MTFFDELDASVVILRTNYPTERGRWSGAAEVVLADKSKLKVSIDFLDSPDAVVGHLTALLKRRVQDDD